MGEIAAGRVLQLLGPSAGGIRRHVATLSGMLTTRGWRVEIAGPPGVMDGLAVQQHTVAVPGGSSPAGAWAARRSLRALAERFDLIHAHGLKAGWVAASLRRHPPLVVTIHNVVLEEAAGRRAGGLRVLERLLPARTDALVAVSSEIARRFVGAPGADRVVVIAPVGPPLEPVRPRAEVRAGLAVGPDEPLVVTATARLHPQKDLVTFLRAMAAVRHTHPAARAAIVGDGPQRSELEAEAEALGLGDAVRFTGWVPNFADLLVAADVVVVSSLWEGAPIALAEAMRLGRPVVATAVGAIPEVVVDRETGRLVPARDAVALAEAIGAALDDPGEAARMAEAGRDRVAELLDPDLLVSAVEEVYRATLDP